ncbi:CBD9-like protein [Thelephora terrestris]|uniref:CBD9-like protein n=1 Tax=Thelephora terrestris TaxID=56493 RepID=A0A9P6LAK0_9AGAM|nr:CBD9-like protein [Thelephora terrestris]
MRFPPRLALTALLATSYVSARHIARQSSTGDSKCFQYMCVNATVTGSEVEYVLSGTGQKTVGWMAIGWGRQMSGTEMVVVWPNSDGTFTLSQRTGTGHVLPTVDSNPSPVATKQDSVTGSSPSFVFTVPVSGTLGSEYIIWAFGDTNPGSSSPSASFTQHLDMGETSLNLAGSIGTGTSASSPSSTGGSGSTNSGGSSLPLTKTDRMIIAHGILCVVGFLFLLPLGSLVARYFRTSTNTWFKAHQTIQSLLAGPIIVVGWSLGIAVVASGGGSHFYNTHTRLGLALFVLYVIQVLLGNIIHRFKPKSSLRRRPAQNYFHVFLGIVIISASFFQVHTGYKDEFPLYTDQGPLPHAADIIFYVWVVLIPVLYLAGLAFLPKQFSQEADSRQKRAAASYEMRGGYRES